MDTKLEIAKNWLPRYTGMPLEMFGDYILITNFKDYVLKLVINLTVMFMAKEGLCKPPLIAMD